MGLFSTTYVHNSNRPTYPQKVNVSVIERRAPTDESIRLLKEMQEKAESKVLESMILSDGTMEVAVLVFEDLMSQSYSIKIGLKLNGRFYQINDQIHKTEFTRAYMSMKDYFDTVLIKKISNIITATITEDLRLSLGKSLATVMCSRGSSDKYSEDVVL